MRQQIKNWALSILLDKLRNFAKTFETNHMLNYYPQITFKIVITSNLQDVDLLTIYKYVRND